MARRTGALQKENLSNICRLADRNGADSELLTWHFLDSQAALGDSRLQRRLLKQLIEKYVSLERRVTDLLRNTLPGPVAEEIKYRGHYAPRPFHCTILFLDIAGFTRLAERMTGEALIDLINELFSGFDDLITRCRGTKIKTIGDAYMVVFGAPEVYPDHAVQGIQAALEILEFLGAFNKNHRQDVQMRAGIHTGRVMAGVVGRERMQFDVFGDDVNIAARFEAAGLTGRVNVSQTTYLAARDRFDFEPRGKIALKNKADMPAYFAAAEKGAES
jgi:class 3 adenylate cyclase